ncbi:MAG: hypothetical protein IJJ52_02700 [Lachnospiraceae bacterium]|nr:hypothetical protein [Lachnospiraceae bacterium]
MFGYVTVNQDDLKVRDFKRYRGFYCGLCESLRKRYGLQGQSILPYDMVFVDILLNGVYETPLLEKDRFCLTHPFKKQHMIYNEISDYTADMGVLLAYYKLLDDVRDAKSRKAKAGLRLIRKSALKVRDEWPRQAEAAENYIRQLTKAEEEKLYDLDEVAGFTGTFLGEIFVMREDLWSDFLRRCGFFLGKYIYLMDAYEDLEKDIKKGCYNPWEQVMKRKDFDALVENTLTMMMAECAREFEKLPIVQDIDMLRNIIYSGVWTKFNEIKMKRCGEGQEDDGL